MEDCFTPSVCFRQLRLVESNYKELQTNNEASGMEYSHRQDRVPIAHSPSQLDNLNWKKHEKDQEYRKKKWL